MSTSLQKAKRQHGKAVVQRSEKGRASILATMGERWGCDPEVLQRTIMSTCLKGGSGFVAQPEHVVAFLIVAREYDLNPFIGEIHGFIKDGSVHPIIGIDGRVTLINRQPDYDGVEFAWGYADGRTEPIDPLEMPLSCTCTIHHKNRSYPTVVAEFMAECKRNTSPWQQHPRRMLRHKALIQCGRVAFGLRMYDEEDFTELQDAVVVEPTTPAGPDKAVLDMAAGTDYIPRKTKTDEDKPAPKPVPDPVTDVPDDPDAWIDEVPLRSSNFEAPPSVVPTPKPDPKPVTIEDPPKAKPEPTPTGAKMRKAIQDRAMKMAAGDVAVAQAFVKEWSAGLSPKFTDGFSVGAAIPKTYVVMVANRSKTAYDEWSTPTEPEASAELADSEMGIGPIAGEDIGNK